MIGIKNLFYLMPFILLMAGCAAGSTTALKDLHEEQNSLEIRVDKLTQDLKAAQAENDELEKQLQDMAQVIKRLGELSRYNGTAKLTYHANGALYESSKSYNDPNSGKKQESPKKQFSEIESVNSADELHSLAENFRSSKNYAYAVLTFQEFIDRFPNDSRVPRAYLKQGIALMEMGKSTEARFFLEDLVYKFPKSAEAQIALHKLSKLRQ